MFLELAATVFAGVATAGVIMLVNRLTGGRLPRWLMLAGAAVAMISMTIFMEYSWFKRTTASLPPGVEVAQQIEKKSLYRPWTYLVPYVDRFVAVDTTSLKRHPKVPDQRMGELYFFGRWAALQRTPVLVDCAGLRRATLIDGMEFDEHGQVVDAPWINVDASDRVVAAVCGVA